MSEYKQAGVDLDEQAKLVKRIKKAVKPTFNEYVLSDIGAFGSIVRIPVENYKKPVLVASCDGVGTKALVAAQAQRLDLVGEDLVNHCINDVLVQGALQPLFFMDYYGASSLDSQQFLEAARGMARACKKYNIPLIGGETAEMRDVYVEKGFELVGFIVALAEKDLLLSGKEICPGDMVIGLPSNGLHTNGYSLARKIIFSDLQLSLKSTLPGLSITVEEALLQPHLCYLDILKEPIRKGWVKACIHITGGGLIDNPARVLPDDVDCIIQVGNWVIPEIFRFFQEQGDIPIEEMFRIFNMGIGMVLIIDAGCWRTLSKYFKIRRETFYHIGTIESGRGNVVIQL